MSAKLVAVWLVPLLLGASGCASPKPTPTPDTRLAALHPLCQACRFADPHFEVARFPESLGEDASLTDLRRIAQDLGVEVRLFRLDSVAALEGQFPLVTRKRDGRLITLVTHDREQGEVFVLEREGEPYWARLTDLLPLRGSEALAVCRSAKLSGPYLWIPRESFELGLFAGIKNEERTLTLLNCGHQPLHIQEVKVSCGCGQAWAEPATVPPFSYTRIKFLFDMTVKGPGPFVLSVLVISDDHEEPKRTFGLTGIVTSGVRLVPSLFSFGDLPPTEPEKELLTKLQFPDSAEVTLQPARLQKGLHWRSYKRLRDGSYEVRFLLKLKEVAVDEQGNFRVDGTVITSHPLYKEVSLRAVGRRLSWIEVVPSQVYVGQVVPGSRTVRVLRLQKYTTGIPEVTVADSGLVKAQVQEEALRVEVVAPQKAGIFRTVVQLRAGRDQVTIPVLGLVTGGADP